MNLASCRANFNMGELYGIDSNNNRRQAELQLEYDGLLYQHTLTGAGHPSFIIASLTHHQLEAANFLLANGFRQIGDIKINPNTTNKITTYLKKMEPKLSAESYMKMHNDAWIRNYHSSPDFKAKPYLSGAAISCSTMYLMNPTCVARGVDCIMYPGFGYKPQCAIVITAIPSSCTDKIKILEDNQFFKIDEANGYYLDEAPVSIYMRYVNAAQRKEYACQTGFDVEGRTE